LVNGKEVELKATASGTDCSLVPNSHESNQRGPKPVLSAKFPQLLPTLQLRVNSRDETIYTYMGKLFARLKTPLIQAQANLTP
jgi:uncharacterized protein (DUF39 family)